MIPADWIFGLLGGLMIGSAAALFLLGNGRIMGASGLLGGLVDGSGRSNAMERLVFLGGVIGTPALIVVLSGGVVDTGLTQNLILVVVAGLAVGFGTRMANGCTSGHGVCGISRFSIRGIVATISFLIAGFATMALARHGLGII